MYELAKQTGIMNDITVLENQVLIMKALLSLVGDKDLKEKLKDQIMFTKARISALT